MNSYISKMIHRRQNNTNNVNNPSSHAFSTSNSFRIQSTDNADKSRWMKCEDEITNILETGCYSHGQGDALNSDQDKGIFQNPNKLSWGLKECKQFPVYDDGDFILKCNGKREKHDASSKNQCNQTNFKHRGLNVEGSNKGVNYPRSSELSCMPMITMPGNVVQNGTSHQNIAWATNVLEDGYFELGKCTDSATLKINLDKRKGKVIMEDKDFHARHNLEAHSNKSSECSAYKRHVSSNTSSLPYEEDNNLNKQGTSHQRFMRDKRKQHLSNFCEISRVSDGWSGISSQNNSFNCDMELDELQSLKLSFNNCEKENLRFDDENTRVSQIESDELLARRLQEQYYEEVSGTMFTNEIDANISCSLQEKDSHLVASGTRSDQINNIDANSSCFLGETDSHLPAATTRSDQTNNREEPMADLYAYYTQLASHSSSSRSSHGSQHQMSNARRNFHSSEIDLETRMVAELRNFTRMDPGMRHDFLEALEAAFDQSNSALDDFNEDGNYEMLVALDGHAHASENQIDSLPQSTIQGSKVEEICVICLEVPTFGDTIRHLPCLHKFHLKCIDVWLRRKACCPVLILTVGDFPLNYLDLCIRTVWKERCELPVLACILGPNLRIF